MQIELHIIFNHRRLYVSTYLRDFTEISIDFNDFQLITTQITLSFYFWYLNIDCPNAQSRLIWLTTNWIYRALNSQQDSSQFAIEY